MATPYNGTSNLPFGGETLSISGGSFVVMGEWNPQHETRIIERTDANGDPTNQFIIRGGRLRWSGNLMMPLSTTTIPTIGATFAHSYANYGTVTFVVAKALLRKPSGGGATDFHYLETEIMSETNVNQA